MMFCPNDKSMMRPVRGKLTCPKCGHVQAQQAGALVVKGEPVEVTRNKFSEIGVIDDPAKFESQIWPIDDQVYCGHCGNFGAYYQLRQTRKADEPTTRFYQCTKCKRKWKSSK
ncbi:MAG TPA: transcription factor S [Candidatus Thermoplasmatota archaeon]|nr:transcription factor S [Candidatus Thermoplasmatota archaeon]